MTKREKLLYEALVQSRIEVLVIRHATGCSVYTHLAHPSMKRQARKEIAAEFPKPQRKTRKK